MPPSTRIPPLLQPCVHLPHDDSILLVTSTLGASVNWLLIRFLCHALSDIPTHHHHHHRAAGDGAGKKNEGAHFVDNAEEEEEKGLNVVLVSWMRDYAFWRQEARKGGGLDLEKLRKEGRVAVVDGLSGLFLGADHGRDDAVTAVVGKALAGQKNVPVRGGGSPLRTTGLVPPAPRGLVSRSTTTTTPSDLKTATTSQTSRLGLYTLHSPDLAHIQSTLHAAIAHVASSSSNSSSNNSSNHAKRTLIILDNPDFLLATTDAQSFSASSLTALFLDLHAQPSVAHVAVHVQADTPLLSPGSPAPQPIEVEQRNLVVKTAHMSRRVLSARVLDTGVARDVSGVLRVTESERACVDLGIRAQEEEEGRERRARGQEMLYKIGGDGSVKVFERGAGG